MGDGRVDAIQPASLVAGARSRERRPRELLRIEPVRTFLRRVAADRKSAGQRLRLEAVAETGLVIGVGDAHRCRARYYVHRNAPLVDWAPLARRRSVYLRSHRQHG